MILSKEEICRWANISDSKRNLKEGERIINAGHIIYCGKNIDFNVLCRDFGFQSVPSRSEN